MIRKTSRSRAVGVLDVLINSAHTKITHSEEIRFDGPNRFSKVRVMKLLQVTLATLALGSGLAHAGPAIDKNPLPVDAGCPCFFPGLQVGTFASAYLARGKNEESAAGAGVNFTYFFTENIGLEYS